MSVKATAHSPPVYHLILTGVQFSPISRLKCLLKPLHENDPHEKTWGTGGERVKHIYILHNFTLNKINFNAPPQKLVSQALNKRCMLIGDIDKTNFQLPYAMK